MQYNGSTSSVRNVHHTTLISEDNIWIAQSHSLTSAGITKHSEMALSNEHKLELETHHSSTIFCDMMSPDEWKSSLPMVFQQNDLTSIANSPTSPSNSIENLVLELENSSQDIDMGSPFNTQCPDTLLLKVPFPDKYEEELVCNMDSEDVDNMLFGMLGTEKEIDSDTLKLSSPTEKQSSDVINDAKHKNVGIENRSKTSVGPLTTETLTDVKLAQPKEVSITESDCAQPAITSPKTIEEAPIPTKDKKDSLQCLTSLLAEVVHCKKRDDVSILQKATSTISTLRQQACDLMSTYSQLKFQNDELIQQQNLLHSEQFVCDSDETSTRGCPMTIEVLIPSGGAKRAFDSAPLYHHIPIEDGQIPTIFEEDDPTQEIVMDEPYEEQYDVPMVIKPISETNPCKTKNLSCELGCICSSLQNARKLPVEHCKNLDCMLEPSCTRSGDPSHTPNIVFSIQNDSKVIPDVEDKIFESIPNVEEVSLKCSSKTTSLSVSRATKSAIQKKSTLVKKPRRTVKKPIENEVVLIKDPKIDSKDPKLLGDCNVRLTRIDPMTLHRMENGAFDVKLHSKCFVQIKRFQGKKKSVYCMVHRLYCCTCLGSTND